MLRSASNDFGAADLIGGFGGFTQFGEDACLFLEQRSERRSSLPLAFSSSPIAR